MPVAIRQAWNSFVQPLYELPKEDRFAVSICLALCVSYVFQGFDGGVFSVIFGSESFKEHFGFSDEDLGTIAVLGTPGVIFGVLIVQPVLANFAARKTAFLFHTTLLSLGVVLMVIGTNAAMFIFGRILAGIGTGGLGSTYVAYLSEIAPTPVRGLCLSFVQFAYNFGTFISFWIGVGTEKIKSNNGASWRCLIALQLVFGVATFLLALFAPESPRKLLELSRDPTDQDEATVRRAISELARIRNRPVDSLQVIGEYERVSAAISLRRKTKQAIPYKRLLVTKGFWIRWWYSGVSLASGQMGGISALLIYGVIVFQSLGFTAKGISFILNGVGGSLQLLAGVYAMLFADRHGRKTLLLSGLGLTEISLLILSVLFTIFPNADNHGAAAFSVVCVFLIFIAYSAGSGPGGIMYAGEIWPEEIRELGWAVSCVVQSAFIILYQKGFPSLISVLGGKTYWVFLGINTIPLLLVFLTWPETKNIPLEEMGQLFGEVHVDVNLGSPVGAKKQYPPLSSIDEAIFPIKALEAEEKH